MSDAMMEPVNKFYQVYNEANPDLWEEAVSTDYVGHVNSHTIPGRDAGKGFVVGLIQAFPDIHYTVEDTLIQGDKVVTRWSATGTHTGDLYGMPPTNKKANMLGITIFRIADGQIAELWNVWDQAGLMQQLNA
jgi:steroid delta-isomerase-like uncharacterized protein